ncbi:MAG: hypothetical protein ACT4O9_08595 [Blastocatellia bacterium]
MKTQHEILHLLKANRRKIKSFGVRELGVFGSVARAEQTETSGLTFWSISNTIPSTLIWISFSFSKTYLNPKSILS